MAKAMITLTWCDKHLTEKDEEVPAEPFTWDALQVDLCEECAGPLIAARALFTEYGSNGKRTQLPRALDVKPPFRQKVDAISCPMADCGAVLSSRSSLAAHVRQMHDMTLGEAEGKPLKHKCRWCDAKYATPQGVSLHERARHRDDYQKQSAKAPASGAQKARAR